MAGPAYDDPGRSPGHRDGRAIAIYTAARAGLLVICLAVGWWTGLSGPMLIIAALLVSGIVSWFVLRRQRVAMGYAVEHRVGRARSRVGARAAAEDAYVDALQAGVPTEDRTG